MRLKVIDIDSDSESESDYETAVDMSHWSMSRDSVLFETPGGVRFTVSSRWEQTTFSYMEPDFDHMEKTGQTVWQTHTDESRNEREPEGGTHTYGFDGLYIARPELRVSVAEFQETMKRFVDNKLDAWDLFYDDNGAQAVNHKVAAFVYEGDARPMKAEEHFHDDMIVQPNRQRAEIEHEEIVLLSGLDVKKGRTYDVELSPAFQASILAAEELHAKISADNADIRAENRIHAARARIGNLIDDMAEAAMIGLKNKTHSAARP